MIRRVLMATAAVLAGSAMVASAAPKDEVADAAKKLADANNYSWKSTTASQGGQGGQGGQGQGEGKTEKGGFTHLTMTRGENSVEAVVKGEKGAVKTQGGWKSFAELASAAQDNQGQGGQRRGGGGARMFQNYRTPAVEAQELATKVKELTKADDAYTGELTDEAVQSLVSFRGGGGRRGQGGAGAGEGNGPPPATNAKGTVKFFVKDGALSKYEYHLTVTRSFNGNDFNIHLTTTVEIKDVGSTKVEVPAEAKAKIS